MAISFDDAERLREAGFTEYEITQFAIAHTPSGKDQPPINLNGEAWQKMMESRKDWVDARIAEGWTMDEVENQILSYYQAGARRSPYDFLKREYRSKHRADYHAAMRKRMNARIRRGLPGYGL